MAHQDWKPGAGQRIEYLYAWVAEEPDGGEGIVAGSNAVLGLIPLIGADQARVESYRSLAEVAAKATGYPVRLKVFSGAVVIDEIT